MEILTLMKEIGSEFWDIPIGFKQNAFFDNATWFISGRAALRAILKQILTESTSPSFKVALPSYLCESMIEPFEAENIEYCFYSVGLVDEGLKCDLSSVDDCDAIVVIDYFGYESKLINCPRGKIIIRDITHSMFIKEYRDADYYFGSLRKWAGFICGGFALKNIGRVSEANSSNDNYVTLRKKAMLLKSKYMSCENYSKEYLNLFHQAETFLDGCEILQCDSNDIESARTLNIEFLKKTRRENAQVIIDGLREYCLFKKIGDNDCPLFVPIICENRDELKRYLISNSIYCPVHWPKPSLLTNNASDNLYNKELSLVCDQRYSKEDMRRIVNTVLSFMEGIK